MDLKLRKRIAEYIVTLLGLLFIAIGVSISLLPWKLHWIVFLDATMGITEGFLIYLTYVFLQIPMPENLDMSTDTLGTEWIHVNSKDDTGGTVSFWVRSTGEVSWEDPNVSNTT